MLHIHRAERADRLAIALAGLLATPLADPFVSEIVSVPTRGMERWLAQRLSSHLGAQPGRADGVCAGVLFPPPRRLIGDAVAAASGIDPDADPWLAERAAWPLLDVVAECLDEPWLDALRGYLGHSESEPDPVRRDRRLSIVRHLAGLFARYSLHRPEMVNAWAAGGDGDGDGGHCRLARRGRRSCGGRCGLASCSRARPSASTTRAHGYARTARCSISPRAWRCSGSRACRRAICTCCVRSPPARRAPVPPSPLAGAVGAHRTGQRRRPPQAPRPAARRPSGGRPVAPRRENDPTAALAVHPLLASWGRDAREMQLVLSGHSAEARRSPPPPAPGPGHRARASAGRPARRSGRRRGCRSPASPIAARRCSAADRSVQVHACHGQARQVEVLRDAVLHLLAADPTLEPRDVIVMCPDIETFAPLIQATFGAAATEPGDEAPGRGPVDLHVRLADRSLRQTNAVLAALAALLELAGSRVTASQVLGFADREPVRRRFGLRDEDLTRLQRWIGDAGIRWGLDAAHRAPFKLDDLDTGTWAAGLDRLLLGAAMTEEGNRLYGGVLPLDDVESTAIDLAGRLGELVDSPAGGSGAPERAPAVGRVGERADPRGAVADRHGPARRLAARRVAAHPRRARGPGRGERPCDRGDRGPQRALSLAEIRGLLAERLAGRPTRANFRTGHMTVCTLYPMRSVPHRVVCLLGLDDGAFPRRLPRDGDDLMLDRPRVGERDPRSEDRQMLLDAVLAATEHLLITYTGHDERTNLPRPPAVPVGELLDVLDATVRGADGPARAQIEVGASPAAV